MVGSTVVVSASVVVIQCKALSTRMGMGECDGCVSMAALKAAVVHWRETVS